MDIHKKIKFATNDQTLTFSKRSIQTDFDNMCLIPVSIPCNVDTTGNSNFLIFELNNTVYNNLGIVFNGNNSYYVIIAEALTPLIVQLCRIGGTGPNLGKITDILTNDCTPI